MSGKSKAGAKSGKPATGTGVGARKPADLEAVRTRIRNYVGNRALDMVKASVDEIEKKGNVAAMKFLFELAGLFPETEEGPEQQDDSLALTLLKRFALPGSTASEPSNGNHNGSDPQAAEGDSLE